MSPPPYELRDKATGQVVPGFESMDTKPGKYIEVWSAEVKHAPTALISEDSLERPTDGVDPPDPPDPPDPNPPENAMDYPQNEQELKQCLQSYADNGIVGKLDPRTDVDVHSTIVISQKVTYGVPWGVDGSYGKINFKGSGQDLLRYEGVQGQNNRGLTLKNLTLDGGDVANMSGGGAKACLRVSAPLGDNGPIYKFHIENVYTAGAVNGIVLEGGVYEGEMKNIHAENCTGDGVVLQHMMNPIPPGGHNPIVSNVLILHINSSRNFGAGLRTVYSVRIFGGSFILNGGGGVVAPEGIAVAMSCNGENTGGQKQAVFDVQSNGYGSYIELGEASSDGSTHCRRWDGSKWVSVGKPLLYFIAMAGGVSQRANHCSYYGSGSNPMQVVAPSTAAATQKAPAAEAAGMYAAGPGKPPRRFDKQEAEEEKQEEHEEEEKSRRERRRDRP